MASATSRMELTRSELMLVCLACWLWALPLSARAEQPRVSPRVAEAIQLERQRAWPEARAAYLQVLREEPGDFLVWHRLAVVCTATGDHATAADCFNRALQLQPRHVELLTDAGFACYVRREYPAAVELLVLAVRQEPKHPRAWNNLGLVLGMMGHTEEALEALGRMQSRPQALLSLAFVHQQRGELEQARARVLEARTLDPQIVIPASLETRGKEPLPQPTTSGTTSQSTATHQTTAYSEDEIPPSPAPPLDEAPPSVVHQPALHEESFSVPELPSEAPATQPLPATVNPEEFVTPVPVHEAHESVPAELAVPEATTPPQPKTSWKPTRANVVATTTTFQPVTSPPKPVVQKTEPVAQRRIEHTPAPSTAAQTWTMEVTPAVAAVRKQHPDPVTVRHQFTKHHDTPGYSRTERLSVSPASMEYASNEQTGPAIVRVGFDQTSDTTSAVADSESVTPIPPSPEALELSDVCLVTLTERLQLVRGLPEFQETHLGETYCFCSAEAAARFRLNPEMYRPVAGGLDVVGVHEGSAVTRGTFDHAAWYRHRLYLFSSAEHLQRFSMNPQSYLPTEK